MTENINKIIEKLKFESNEKGDLAYLISKDLENNLILKAKQKANILLENLLNNKEKIDIIDINIERKIILLKEILNLEDSHSQELFQNSLTNLISDLENLSSENDEFLGLVLSQLKIPNINLAKQTARTWYISLIDNTNPLVEDKRKIINKILNLQHL